MTAAGFDGPVLSVPDDSLYQAGPAPVAELGPADPAADRLHVRHGR